MAPEYICVQRCALKDWRLTFSDIKFLLALSIRHQPGESFQTGKGDLADISSLSYSSVKRALLHLSSLKYLVCAEVDYFKFQISLPDCADCVTVSRAIAERLLALHDAGAIAVYLWIAADSKQGSLEKGLTPFCQENNVSRTTFRYAIQTLEKQGALKVERNMTASGVHATNCYHVL